MRSRTAVVVCPSLGGGGAERATLALAGGLQALGVNVTLVLEKEVAPLFEAPEVHRVVELRSSSTRATLWPLRRVIRETCPDFVYSCLPHLNVVCALALYGKSSGIKFVPSIHNNSAAEYAAGVPNGRALRLLTPLVYRRSDGVVAVSGGVAESLSSIGSIGSKIWVIPNALDETFLDQVETPETTGTKFISSGRLVQQKNFSLLVRAFALYAEEYPDSHLTILGDGPLRDDLTSLIKDLGLNGAVSLPGEVTDPRAWLDQSSVYVQTSVFEGFGLAILEAMARRLPVISTDCDFGPRELIEHSVTGLLVRPEPSSVADAMANLSRSADLRRAFGDAGRHVAEAFRPTVLANTLLTHTSELGVAK